MKFQLLQSTFNEDGTASVKQHLSCLVVNDRIAIDAGSLAIAATDEHRRHLRDIVLTHAHLDHIAGLPPFIDDLFATLEGPVRVHASSQVIDSLEQHIFNWSIYPRFSELRNANGPVIEYHPFEIGHDFVVGELTFTAVGADHKVPSAGFLVSDGTSTVAITGDTASIRGFSYAFSKVDRLNALLIECAFPNAMLDLAEVSHHMTPKILESELHALDPQCPIFIVNIKPMYRDAVVRELSELMIHDLSIMNVGQAYFW